MSGARAIDEGEKIEMLLLVPIDVHCPVCDARALVRSIEGAVLHSERRPLAPLNGPHRLSCGSCGLVREADGRRMTIHHDGRDPWFHATVWLRDETSAGVVWAYHSAHLHALRDWIAADHRECRVPGGWRSRLPRSLSAASARPVVLRSIDALLGADPDGGGSRASGR